MVVETVQRARRRILANSALQYGAYAVAAAFGCVILLLLLGTQILDWRWLGLIPTLTLAGGLLWVWRSAPTPYQAAQQVDRNLGLSDALSTALFFAGSDRRVPEDVRRAQREQAESLARAMDLRRAVPLRVPRAIYWTATFAVAATSLFVVRYLLDRRLDLHAPLVRVIQARLGMGTSQLARRNAPAARQPQPPKENGAQPDGSDTGAPEELDAAPQAALDNVGVPDVDNSKNPTKAGKDAAGDPAGNDKSTNVSAGGKDGQSGEGQPGSSQNKPESADNSSLLGRMRDAMSNLLSRMQSKPGNPGTRQPASAQGGQQSQKDAGANPQNGKSSENGGAEQADGQSGEPGEAGQNAQSASAGNTSKDGQNPANKQSGNGIGRQDGSKDIKAAEQLAAMGKISEIIGKRSANVSGELTIEVRNSNQQLRTPYSPSNARHAEAGGEISRDEVPLALEAYVQQYFEELRKQAPDAAHADSRAHHRADPKTPGF